MITVFYSDKNYKSEIFIKKSLKKYNGKDYEVKRTVNKKPYVDDNLFFSVSHTEGIIICVVSDKEIGADIEKIREINSKKNICMKYFGVSENVNDIEFLKLWTSFESRLKYYGEKLFKCVKAKTSEKNVRTFVKNGYVLSICTDSDDEINKEMIE